MDLGDQSAALVGRDDVQRIIDEQYQGYLEADGVKSPLDLVEAQMRLEALVEKIVYACDGDAEDRRALWVAIDILRSVTEQVGPCSAHTGMSELADEAR